MGSKCIKDKNSKSPPLKAPPVKIPPGEMPSPLSYTKLVPDAIREIAIHTDDRTACRMRLVCSLWALSCDDSIFEPRCVATKILRPGAPLPYPFQRYEHFYRVHYLGLILGKDTAKFFSSASRPFRGCVCQQHLTYFGNAMEIHCLHHSYQRRVRLLLLSRPTGIFVGIIRKDAVTRYVSSLKGRDHVLTTLPYVLPGFVVVIDIDAERQKFTICREDSPLEQREVLFELDMSEQCGPFVVATCLMEYDASYALL